MKVNKSVQLIPVSEIEIPHDLNYRDEEAYTRLKSLRDDIAQNGQTTPTALEKRADGKYVPNQGFRRATVITQLAAEGVINPETGKPFDSVKAIVYSEMTDRDRYRLKFDEGNRVSLNRREFQRALEDGFRSGYTEGEIVNQGYQLFTTLYPPNRKIEDTDQAKLDYYRGVLQTAKRAWQAPDVLHDAWMSKLAGEHKWPTNTQLKELVDTHTKECEAPGGIAFSRSKPGPKFLKAWEEYMKKVSEADANGDSRPKNASMMNHQQHEDIVKTSDSVILKTAFNYALRKIQQDTLPVFDKFLQTLEASLTEEQRAELLSFSTAPEEAETPATV